MSNFWGYNKKDSIWTKITIWEEDGFSKSLPHIVGETEILILRLQIKNYVTISSVTPIKIECLVVQLVGEENETLWRNAGVRGKPNWNKQKAHKMVETSPYVSNLNKRKRI